jgi:hypothetical protein
MHWEAVTAIGTVFTGIVIFLTVIYAARQADLARQHIWALRQATQLEGAISIFAELESARFEAARQFVLHRLPVLLQDPKFRDEVRLIAQVDEAAHQELVVLRAMDQIGIYVDEGLIDANVIYRGAVGRIITMWEALKDVIAIHRETAEFLWGGFERLAVGAREWAIKHEADLDRVGRLMGEHRARVTSSLQPGAHETRADAPSNRPGSAIHGAPRD